MSLDAVHAPRIVLVPHPLLSGFSLAHSLVTANDEYVQSSGTPVSAGDVPPLADAIFTHLLAEAGMEAMVHSYASLVGARVSRDRADRIEQLAARTSITDTGTAIGSGDVYVAMLTRSASDYGALIRQLDAAQQNDDDDDDEYSSEWYQESPMHRKVELRVVMRVHRNYLTHVIPMRDGRLWNTMHRRQIEIFPSADVLDRALVDAAHVELPELAKTLHRTEAMLTTPIYGPHNTLYVCVDMHSSHRRWIMAQMQQWLLREFPAFGVEKRCRIIKRLASLIDAVWGTVTSEISTDTATYKYVAHVTFKHEPVLCDTMQTVPSKQLQSPNIPLIVEVVVDHSIPYVIRAQPLQSDNIDSGFIMPAHLSLAHMKDGAGHIHVACTDSPNHNDDRDLPREAFQTMHGLQYQHCEYAMHLSADCGSCKS